MKIERQRIADVVLIEPIIYEDERGFFFESFNKLEFEKLLNLKVNFVQENYSSSKKNVIRGLHFQLKGPQAKLVRVISGEIFDVAVDLRPKSKTFGKWVGCILSEQNKKQLWIPEGFAHGFLVMSDNAEVLYKVNVPWDSQDEQCLLWCDKDIGIQWPIKSLDKVILSGKDKLGLSFCEL